MYGLVVLSILFGLGGFFFLSEATTGVGIIGLACLFGILARISQASSHHQELLENLKQRIEKL